MNDEVHEAFKKAFGDNWPFKKRTHGVGFEKGYTYREAEITALKASLQEAHSKIEDLEVTLSHVPDAPNVVRTGAFCPDIVDGHMDI